MPLTARTDPDCFQKYISTTKSVPLRNTVPVNPFHKEIFSKPAISEFFFGLFEIFFYLLIRKKTNLLSSAHSIMHISHKSLQISFAFMNVLRAGLAFLTDAYT